MLEKMKREICGYINGYKSVTEVRKKIKNMVGESKKETKEFNELEEKMKKNILGMIEQYHKIGGNYNFMLELKESEIIE